MRIEETVRITSLGNDGEGVGELPSGKKIFVPGALPGEICRVSLEEEKKRFALGKLVEIEKPSPFRTGKSDVPGANLIHLSYDKQLEYKEDKVRSCLCRIGKIDDTVLDKVMHPVIPSNKMFNYRNHTQYKISNAVICASEEGTGQPLPVTESPLEYASLTRIRKVFEDILRDAPTDIFCGIVLRGSERTSEALVELVSDSPLPHEELITAAVDYIKKTETVEKIRKAVPEMSLRGITLRISNSAADKRARSGKRVILTGEDFYEETMCGCTFRIKAGAFFQVNIPQAEKLYAEASSGISNAKTVWDLYCGTGSIGLSCIGKDQELIGIDCVSRAIESAKINAKLSGIEATFLVRDIGRSDLTRDDLKRPDAVITDPPRKGMDIGFVNKLINIGPDIISYVSCDPATMARDLSLLTGRGDYEILSVTPVDMFPQTSHVEVVSLLQRVSNTRERTITLDVEMEDYHRIKNEGR